MILWCDGAHDAPENMRRDRELLDAFERSLPGESPVLRLFTFAPPGITLGASQRPERDLDLEACRRDGVSWAVRPTGGRAIFHAEEWTYSFCGRCDDARWGGTLLEAYARVAELVARSLVRLGVPVEVAGARHARRAPGAGIDAACFASTGHHEIVLAGRKLVGSAQRRLTRGFLQQGSLLLGPGHTRLADYLPLAEAGRERLREELGRRSVEAGRWLGRAPLTRWADALRSELGSGVRLVEGDAGLEALTLPKAGSYTS
jgi:lipoate-protein ligase A